MTCILVVEDDDIIQQLLVETLELEGYECVAASDGQTGVELARKHNPDVVLMDLMLPVMSGVDAIKILQDDPLTDTCQILVMAAMPHLQRVADDLDVGGVISKPIDIETVVADVSMYAE